MAPIAERGEEVMFYTYSAHPAACAVADKVLEIMEREGLVARAAELGATSSERLEGSPRHPNVAEIRGRGLLQAIEIVRDRETLAPFARSSASRAASCWRGSAAASSSIRAARSPAPT